MRTHRNNSAGAREEAREEELDLLRQTLREAQAFAKLMDAGVDDPGNFIQRALVPVVRGEMPAIFTVDTAEEVREALEIAEEFELKTILSGCTQAWSVVDLIKSKNASVIVGPITDLPENDEDPYDSVFSLPAKLAAAGVKFALSTRDSAHVRDLPFLAGMAAAFGLSKEEALKAVTIYPAEILGVSDPDRQPGRRKGCQHHVGRRRSPGGHDPPPAPVHSGSACGSDQ